MTTKVKHSIDIADIAALTLECRECGCFVAVPAFGKIPTNGFLNCPNCHEEWMANGHDKRMKDLFEALHGTLKELKGAMESRAQNHFGFNLALEVKCEEAPANTR